MNLPEKTLSRPPSLHTSLLASSLTSLRLSPPNIYIVSSEGFSIPTHSLLLTLHSFSLSSLLSSLPTSPLPSLHLPFPALPLSSLLSLLATGKSSSSASFNPLLVVEAAEMLGINLDDLQLGNNTLSDNEMEIFDDTLALEDELVTDNSPRLKEES